MEALVHLLYQLIVLDLWDPIWPNLAASAVLFIPAFWWHHSRTIKKLETNHAHLMHRIEKLAGLAQDVVDAEKKEE